MSIFRQCGSYRRFYQDWIAQARNQEFYGRGVFLELWHFDEYSPATRVRNAPQGKNLQFFGLKTLENFLLNDKFHL